MTTQGRLATKIGRLTELEEYVMPEESNRSLVALDANENLVLPRSFISTLDRRAVELDDPRIYPREIQAELKRSIADYVGVQQSNVVMGFGGDQLIDLLCQIFLDENSAATIVGPTYSFYGLRAKLAGARLAKVAINEDFSLSVDKVQEASSGSTLTFLCSPNNPTGNQFPQESVESLARRLNGLLVVDEAYAEYADYSLAERVDEHNNLIVLRTFSKAFGLASARLGYLVTNRKLAEIISCKAQYPYPVSGFALNLALLLLEQREQVMAYVEEARRERKWLSDEIGRIRGLRVFPSQANFLLIEAGAKQDQILRNLEAAGLRAKAIGQVLNYTGCIRVTVATHEINQRVVNAFTEACA